MVTKTDVAVVGLLVTGALAIPGAEPPVEPETGDAAILMTIPEERPQITMQAPRDDDPGFHASPVDTTSYVSR